MTHTAISEIMNYFLSITKTMNWDFHYTSTFFFLFFFWISSPFQKQCYVPDIGQTQVNKKKSILKLA